MELGEQDVTEPGTHPVVLFFHDMFQLHTSVPSLLPNLTYREHSVNVPFVHVPAGGMNIPSPGPYQFMPTLYLDSFLAELTIARATPEAMQLEIEFGYSVGNRLDINAGFSVVDAQSSLGAFEDSIPDHTAFVAAQFRPSTKHEISGAFYYVDEINWIDTSAVIPVARRLDLRYAYHLRNAFNFEIIGQNLLEDYTDYQPENVHDQVIYLRFSGGF